jgi:hypothetical protein
MIDLAIPLFDCGPIIPPSRSVVPWAGARSGGQGGPQARARKRALSLTAVSTPACSGQIEGGSFSTGHATRYLPRLSSTAYRLEGMRASMSQSMDYALWLIFPVTVIAIWVASEIGRGLGRRDAGRAGGNIGTLEGAVLGLLALMIGFTFAMSLSRFDARRAAVLDEADAIGTTALRARLLPAPLNTDSLKLLQEYTQIRLDAAQRFPEIEMNAAIERSTAIQEQLWQIAEQAAARDPGMVPTGLFITTLNEMIDDQEKRLTAIRTRVPNIVLLALYGIAFIAHGFAGYSDGLDHRTVRLPVYMMAILVAAVILLIQDLDRPTGFIRVSSQPMIDTAASLARYNAPK